MDVSGQGGSVYNETVYRPKDHKIRSQKRRKMLLIGAAAVLLIVLFIIIIAVAVSKGHKPEQALRVYPAIEGNIIKFVQKDVTTHAKYIASLQQLVEEYKSKKQKYSSDLYNCSENSLPPSHKDGACQVSIEELELTSQFGYDTGMPTIILQLKPPVEWTPTLYSNTSDMPDGLSPSILSTDHVPVTCMGQNYADQDNIGQVKITPLWGFPTRYFPYNGQNVYLAPLVAVQFTSLTPSVLVTVRCRVNDPAITHNEKRLFDTTIYIEMNL